MQSKLDKAIEYAVSAHSGATRKGTDIPFILHPLEALTIASTLTHDVDVLCAAVLHDTVEDTDTTIDDIKANFGKSVAKYVLFESENKRKGVPESESWKTRKIETLNLLNKADINEQILVLSDKLANMRAIYRDYQTLGDKLWERFNVKEKQEHAWYYGEIAKRLNLLFGTLSYKEYAKLFEKVFGKING